MLSNLLELVGMCLLVLGFYTILGAGPAELLAGGLLLVAGVAADGVKLKLPTLPRFRRKPER